MAAQAKLGSALRSGRNLEQRLALQCRHFRFAAQCRSRKRNRHLAIEVVLFAGENFVLANMHHDVKIARRTAANSGFTISGRSEPGAVIDPGGNLQFDSCPLFEPAVAPAIPARMIDHLTGSSATRTGLRNLEESSRSNDLAAPLARRAGGCARTGLCSRTTASRAGFVFEDFDLFLSAKRRFLQSDLEIVPKIGPALPAVPIS